MSPPVAETTPSALAKPWWKPASRRPAQLKREHESLLLIKTVESRAKAVQDYVRANHSYEVPEIFQIAIESGSPAYLKWLADQVSVSPTDVPLNT